jgi:hypothetical protein
MLAGFVPSPLQASLVDLPKQLLAVLIAVLAILVPARRRGLVLAGGVVSSLALASLQVAGGPNWLDAGLAPSYLSITAGLLAAGVILAALGGLRRAGPGTPDPWPRARLNASLAVIALGGYGVTLVARAGGVIGSAAALVGLMAIVAGLWLVVRFAGVSGWIERWRARRGERQTGLTVRLPDAAGLGLLAGHLIFVLLALLGLHLLLLLAGVVGASVTGLALARRSGLARLPWELVFALVALLLASGATIQIAGETSLRLSELRSGPFSPAFEPLAALGFLLAAWPLLRLWPFHHAELGPVTPLAGAALVSRIAVPVLPAGTEHWLPLFFPLLILATWYCVVAGDWAQAIRALALAGLVSLHPAAGWGGGVLLAGECLVPLASLAPPARVRGVAGGAVALVGLWQLLPLFTGALQAQTFYTVLLGVSASLALVASTPAPDARPAR